MKNKLFAMENLDEVSGIVDAPDMPVVELEAEQIPEVEEALASSYTETDVQYEDLERAIIAVEALDHLIDLKRRGEVVSFESYRFAAEMCTCGTSTRADSVINPSLSLEELVGQRNTIMGRIWKSIQTGFQKTVEDFHAVFSIFEFQTGRLRQAKKELDVFPEAKRTLNIRGNKWMTYGYPHAKVVTSGSEYAKEFAKVVSIIRTLESAGKDLAVKELGTMANFLKNALAGKSDEAIEHGVKALDHYVQSMISMAKLKKEEHNDVGDAYATEVLLGQFQVVITIPENKTSGNYDLDVERLKKFNLPDFTKSKVPLEFAKKDLSKLCQDSLDMIYEFKKWMNEVFRAQTSFANQVASLPLAIPGVNIVTIAALEGTQLGRVVINIARVLHNEISAIHNLMYGSVKQVAEIAEKYVD